MKVLRILSLVTLPRAGSFAQNVGINTDGFATNASVILDMLKIIPEVVGGKEAETTKGERLCLSSCNQAAVLTKAIQDQQSTTDAQLTQIDELTKPVNQLMYKK